MGNKITTLVTTFFVLMIFMLMISFIATDIQSRDTERLISEFTETIRYNGYITLEQYTRLISSIPYKNVKLNITHNKSGNKSEYTSDNYANALNAANLNFTYQILGGKDNPGELLYSLNGGTDKIYSGTLLYDGTAVGVDKHIYKMRVGDSIQVDLVTFEQTFFDVIASAISGSDPSYTKIIASASGIVLNEKY